MLQLALLLLSHLLRRVRRCAWRCCTPATACLHNFHLWAQATALAFVPGLEQLPCLHIALCNDSAQQTGS